MTPKISVIVPMYNVEKYIGMCIQSIIYQTFKDFELILVDDCSTDNTINIAKQFNDPRIKIFKTPKNEGTPGPPRNFGMEQAIGEYLYFMDSDDVLLPNAFEILLNKIENSKADVAVSTVYFKPNNNEFTNFDDLKFSICKYGEMNEVSKNLSVRLIEDFCRQKGSCLIWQKIYRREFLNKHKIQFRNIHCEDQVFLIEILCATSNIVKFDTPFYVYRTVPNSETNHLNIDKLRERIRNLLQASDVFETILPKAIQLSENNMKGGGNINLTNIIGTTFLNMYTDSHILPFYRISPQKAADIINEEINLYFGNNNFFLKSTLQNFFHFRFVTDENAKKVYVMKTQINDIYNKAIEIMKI